MICYLRKGMQLAFDLDQPYRETVEETFLRVYRQLRVRSRRAAGEAPSILLCWRPYANSVGTLRIRDGLMRVGLSEALRDAPSEVVEALAEVLLAKVFRCQPPGEALSRYRAWLNDGSTRVRLEALRRENGRKQGGAPAGDCYDLNELFDAMNQRYFDGAVRRPALAWSRRASRTHLGHWDPAHEAIVLSRFLDRPEVPRLAVEYVMFHEILHMVHPVECEQGRRKVHHRSFKQAEKRFEGLREAKEVLKRLCAGALSY